MKPTAWFGLVLIGFWPAVVAARQPVDNLNDS
jgi:hypothetical protein